MPHPPQPSAPHSPKPVPIERESVQIPHLPPALEGLTLLHISDTHVSHRSGAGRALHDRVLSQLEQAGPELEGIDLAILTGDYMSRDGDEPMAVEALGHLVRASAGLCRLGCFGIFGNHDHAELKHEARQRAADGAWPLRWMHGASQSLTGLPLEIVGSDWPENFRPAPGEQPASLEAGGPLRLALAHTPDCTPDAHRGGAHLVLAGHTHGGQFRIPLPGGGVLAPYTSSHLIPRRAPAGVYRFRYDTTPEDRTTTLVVTRGIGFQQIPLRVCCPSQIGVYTLRSAERAGGSKPAMPTEPAGPDGKLDVIRAW